MFHDQEIKMMCAGSEHHGKESGLKIALLKIPDEILKTKPIRSIAAEARGKMAQAAAVKIAHDKAASMESSSSSSSADGEHNNAKGHNNDSVPADKAGNNAVGDQKRNISSSAVSRATKSPPSSVSDRLWHDRTVRGHFAISVNTSGEFNNFCAGLDDRLARARQAVNKNHPCFDGIATAAVGEAVKEWVEHQDYGVQESVFFHDIDDNEIEVTYWKQ